MKIKHEQLKQLIEAAIFVADQPLSIARMKQTVLLDFTVSTQAINKVLAELRLDYEPRGIVLRETASGFRFQTQPSLSEWLGRLWQETVPKYSRALLETLALIAYRQPITRGEIEQVRGVTVSSNIMKTLQERDWVQVVGHKEVPGRPALYATTAQFLDFFGLTALTELPDVETFMEAINEAQHLTVEDEAQTSSASTQQGELLAENNDAPDNNSDIMSQELTDSQPAPPEQLH
jgi:segregation and condensation protein B